MRLAIFQLGNGRYAPAVLTHAGAWQILHGVGPCAENQKVDPAGFLTSPEAYEVFLKTELRMFLLDQDARRHVGLEQGAQKGFAPLLLGSKYAPPCGVPRSFRDFYAFEQHVKTARAKRGLDMIPAWYEVPVFYFSNPGSLIGHEQPVYAPHGSHELDYELELGVIIGKGGKDIPPEKAWEHVAGFTIVNDLSARDVQRQEMSVGLGPAKGKDFATAVGPYLVTLDEFQDKIDQNGRVDLEMTARVNGKELSRGNVQSMYHSWPKLIAHASADAELFPGDLLGSGTVGTGCILELGPENTGSWLKPGDVVELEIERLGVLRTPVVARPDGT